MTGLVVPDVVPVSVVVCVRNREALIARCLDSIEGARPAEILVVDGRSSDGTAAIARARGIRVVDDAGAGLGAARQIGAESARHDCVVFVDSDTVVRQDTLADLYREAEVGGYAAVQARLWTLSDRPTYWQRAEAWRRSIQERPGPAPALGCQATLVKREVILAVGFDPAFSGAAEDGDFFFRVRATGATIAYAANAVAYHEDRQSLIEFVRQRTWHGRGLARMAFRHRGRYSAGASTQGAAVRRGVGGRIAYAPFMLASVSCLAIGMTVESINLLFRPDLRRQLRSRR
jgi:glycosyltransferase involved in cell wall biosynthesis